MISLSILTLILGIPLGFVIKSSLVAQKITNTLFSYSVWVLLFFMGLGLGLDKNLMSQLGQLGLQALTISLCNFVFTLIAAYFLAKFLFRDSFVQNASQAQKADDKKADRQQKLSVLKDSLLVLAYFVGGVALGAYPISFLSWLFEGNVPALAGEYTLYALLLFAGMCVGFDLKAFRILQELKGKILLIPILTLLSSLISAPFAMLFFADLPLYHSILVSSGLGYYSLSSSLISQELSPALGSVALLANMLREIFTLILAPILVQYFGKLSPVMVAGATANDCSLPAIAKYCGERYAIVAVFSGVCLTLFVPLLLSFLLYFA